MNKFIFLKCLSVVACFGLFILSMTPAHAIKKCKDAQGKWHYGDIAVRECQNSKVTTLSNSGFVKGELAAPKTEEELLLIESQRQTLEVEKKRKELEEREKVRILSIYETEADIDRQRDNQLYSVDSNIAVHNTFLESMDEKIAHEERKLAKTANLGAKKAIEDKIAEAHKNIEVYSKEVDLLKEERLSIVERFEREKELYIKLTTEKEE